MAKRARKPELGTYRAKRDFSKTAEPEGGDTRDAGSAPLRFVVQKHAASHLHYDLRLEMEGVMRSWAVPKGPSLDPRVRRLAMEVEDHPVEYNEFEGTIPDGEYGGGTVMLWDAGTYVSGEARKGESAERAVLRGYRAGKLSLTFRGERLRGAFTLVRTDTVEGGVRSKWLLAKRNDEEAAPGREITEEVITSVTTGRTMEEIAAGRGGAQVWRSNRGKGEHGSVADSSPAASTLRPMLARTASRPPTGAGWTYEPKYDGIRVLAFATPGSTALVTRNGLEKAPQFPEVAEALSALAGEVGEPLVLDGEVVALTGKEVARFERLQGRMHVQEASRIRAFSASAPAGFIAFDLLLRGEEVLVHDTWRERRAALQEVLEGRTSNALRLAETGGDRKALLRRAEREGWEGLIAKRVDSPYRPGQRTQDWLKLKIENRQELLVGGWTEPRRSRSHFGALLLGYYDERGDLVYAGHTGTGFTRDTLAEMYGRLKRLRRKTSPFREEPVTNEPAHWATPKIVAQVKFNEWTRDGKLRQPVFLGFRDDRDPKTVVREPAAMEAGDPAESGEGAGEPADRTPAADTPANGGKTLGAPSPPAANASGARGAKGRGPGGRAAGSAEELDTPLVRKVRRVAQAGGGELRLGAGGRVAVTSLNKVFYPRSGHTKEDLLVYYARMASVIVPRMKDRPLVLKRFPNGVEGESFYQQSPPDTVPEGVRVETLRIEGKAQRRLVGGSPATLLYTVQLGAVSYDPWHSRVQDLDSADYTILDLDPGPGADFGRVTEVAGWVKEELDALGMHGALKTSGSRGLHVYVPLPRGTPLDAATLVAQIVATRVAHAHPKHATVERMKKKRPRGTVYVDYLQNSLGKTVAGVYAARARPTPTVSTPLSWDELTSDLDPAEFTIETVPGRVRSVGDLWAEAMAKPNSLAALTRAQEG